MIYNIHPFISDKLPQTQMLTLHDIVSSGDVKSLESALQSSGAKLDARNKVTMLTHHAACPHASTVPLRKAAGADASDAGRQAAPSRLRSDRAAARRGSRRDAAGAEIRVDSAPHRRDQRQPPGRARCWTAIAAASDTMMRGHDTDDDDDARGRPRAESEY